MDVQCERCKTEYEFDDALVSGRGTTVKCTNCGLQFKVRPTVERTDNERWVVRTARGQELVFTSLRELQRAITTHEVGRGDTLARGNAPPRTLGMIAELEPFFLARPPRRADPDGAESVLEAGERGEGKSSRMPTLRPPSSAAVPPSTAPARLAHIDRTAPAYAEAGTLLAPAIPYHAIPSVVSRQPSSIPPPLPPPQRPRFGTADYDDARAPNDPPSATHSHGEARFVTSPPPPAHFPPHPPPPTGFDSQDRRGRMSSGEFGDGPDAMDARFDVDSAFVGGPPARRRMGGWIMGAVVLLCMGVLGYKVAEPYLAAGASKPVAHKPLDPRAEKLLSEGEAAFREGNLELAKEKFDRASGVDESDPHVLLDVARLAAARADIPWLKTRLLPESAEDELRDAKRQQTDLGAVAKKAADAASVAAPDDVPAIRARVDALRIVGDRDGARGLVARIIGNASQPETSYVLAALDLAEIDPLWATVIDRLRVAVAGEGSGGRARAALVYALARSGDLVGAKAELDRLAGLSTPSPLLPTLRAFVAAAAATGTKGPLALASGAGRGPLTPASVDVDSLPRRPLSTGGGGGGGVGGGSEASSGDARELLKQAASAENRGQFAKARKLYEDAMHVDPANSEALSGLGSVSLKTGDYASARSYFGHALSLNPNYVPALVGQADAMWAEGDRAGATSHYKDIVDRFPESSGYPSYVKTRAEGSSSGAAPPTDAVLAPTAAPVQSPPSPKSVSAPSVKDPLPPGANVPVPANVPSDLPGAPP